MDVAADRRFEFHGFRLDLDRCELRDPAGRPLAVAGRPYDVLVHLVLHRERVVGKDELLAVAWPRVVVEENNLNQAISTLRRLLGDSRESPRFILTVPGRGYRLVAPTVARVADFAEPAAATVAVPAVPAVGAGAAVSPRAATAGTPTRRWLLGALGVGAAVAATAGLLARRDAAAPPGIAIRSIAVLPFAPLVPDRPDPVLEFGLAETLVNQLSEQPGLTVAPTSSVRRALRGQADPLAAGSALGVAAVLEGHVQVHEGRVRVTARLLDVRTGGTLWAGRFDETQRDLLALQDSLADRLIASLQPELSPVLGARAARRHTSDPEAWRLYLAGRYHWDRRTEPELRKAIACFEAAERLDPRFALPVAGLSNAWARLGVYGLAPPREVMPIARRAAERAMAIDAELAESQVAMGHVLAQHDREWRRGERHLRRAVALRPAYAHAHMLLAMNLAYQHRLDAALASVETARALEPASAPLQTALGLVLYLRREYRAARDHLVPLVQGSADAGVARHYLARVLAASGEAGAAVELLRDRTVPAPGGHADLGRAYALAGRTADAEREVARLEALGARGFGVGYELALVEAALGRRERALAALERAVEDGSPIVGQLRAEPGFDALRDAPRFRTVAARLRFDA